MIVNLNIELKSQLSSFHSHLKDLKPSYKELIIFLIHEDIEEAGKSSEYGRQVLESLSFQEKLTNEEESRITKQKKRLIELLQNFQPNVMKTLTPLIDSNDRLFVVISHGLFAKVNEDENLAKIFHDISPYVIKQVFIALEGDGRQIEQVLQATFSMNHYHPLQLYFMYTAKTKPFMMHYLRHVDVALQQKQEFNLLDVKVKGLEVVRQFAQRIADLSSLSNRPYVDIKQQHNLDRYEINHERKLTKKEIKLLFLHKNLSNSVAPAFSLTDFLKHEITKMLYFYPLLALSGLILFIYFFIDSSINPGLWILFVFLIAIAYGLLFLLLFLIYFTSFSFLSFIFILKKKLFLIRNFGSFIQSITSETLNLPEQEKGKSPNHYGQLSIYNKLMVKYHYFNIAPPDNFIVYTFLNHPLFTLNKTNTMDDIDQRLEMLKAIKNSELKGFQMRDIVTYRNYHFESNFIPYTLYDFFLSTTLLSKKYKFKDRSFSSIDAELSKFIIKNLPPADKNKNLKSDFQSLIEYLHKDGFPNLSFEFFHSKKYNDWVVKVKSYFIPKIIIDSTPLNISTF